MDTVMMKTILLNAILMEVIVVLTLNILIVLNVCARQMVMKKIHQRFAICMIGLAMDFVMTKTMSLSVTMTEGTVVQIQIKITVQFVNALKTKIQSKNEEFERIIQKMKSQPRRLYRMKLFSILFSGFLLASGIIFLLSFTTPTGIIRVIFVRAEFNLTLR